MPKNFFILGLPRSRTAWMSVFLSTANTYCYHEGLKFCDNVEGYQKMLSRDDYMYVGDSDRGLINLNIGKFYPDAPIVVIERDIHDVCDSLINLIGSDPGTVLDNVSDSKKRIYDATRYCNNILVVTFDDINDKLEDIWNHCIGTGFDSKRAEHLIGMNIQTQYLFNDKFMGLVKLGANMMKEGGL